MSWLALLLAASMAVAPAHHRIAKHGRAAKAAPRHKGVKIARAAPAAPPVTAAPDPVATATPTPAPTPAPPSRTRVVLKDDPYSVQSSYIALKAGTVEFNVVNAGMDDHDLTIKGTSSTVFVTAGGEAQLVASLTPGTYRLYCSLPTHEQLGMWTTLTIK